MNESVRPSAVAGLFYEAAPERLRNQVERLLGGDRVGRLKADQWRAMLLPHAGYVYSGRLAARAVSSVSWPKRAILLGPNHIGAGARVALSPSDAWQTPLGAIRLDPGLRDGLLGASSAFESDRLAHRDEHSLEVLVPFLQIVSPELSIACVSIGEPDYDLCFEVGRAVAEVVKEAESRGEIVALVVSSDLNHFLARDANRRKDDRAIDALFSGDPRELFDRILVRERISMCGVLPATALLAALKFLGCGPVTVVERGDSADAGGDAGRVVGYASLLWERVPKKEET